MQKKIQLSIKSNLTELNFNFNLFITGLIILLLSCSCSTEGSSVKFSESKINLTTNQLTAYSIIQNSKYLIVFESGLGDDHSPWNTKKVADQIAKTTDVVLYDRAGYGKSEKNTNPRDIDRLRIELEQVINQFSNGRKVILIGHSLGGLIIRDYAIKNPTKTAGLIFVDSAHELYNSPTQSDEDMMYNLFKDQYGIDFGGTLEIRQLIEDLNYTSTLPNLPDVPVIAITSMKHDANNNAADELYNKTRQDWYNAHDSLKSGITDFTHIATQNSGHYITLEEPALVIESINELLSKLP